jgi:hypothetical protein
MTNKKSKSVSAEKSGASSPIPDEALADRLLELALDLRESSVYTTLPDALQKAQGDLRKTIKKCLQQQREPALREALMRAYEEDTAAYVVLRENVEEMSANALFRRDDGPEMEVTAFVVPLFVHTFGGLSIDQCFQDDAAYEQLRESFQKHGLESTKASVVLVSHPYHLDEIVRIGYCQLSAMAHEAYDAMTRKKTVSADAIAKSMSGWPPSRFAADDSAVELRFLLGFAMKTMDDPFYHVPLKEAAADRYFEVRAERFRQWSERVRPLLMRCLVTDGREAQINFLYQDLFHGGKAAAEREMDMLALLSEVQQTLEQHGIAAEDARAAIAPSDDEEDENAVLRLTLHAAATGALLGSIDKPLALTDNVEGASADLADALVSIGFHSDAVSF